jgi:hypothetical protein
VLKNILVETVLLLCYCSVGAAQTAGCQSIADTAQISEVGAFSNMRHTDEHAYGYSVMLWRAEDCLFGFFESSQGLAGDTPIGALQNLKYDSNTDRLSFSAKLTTGMVRVKDSNGLTFSRDLFVFDGNLKDNTLTGVIIYTLQNDRNFTPTHTEVVLERSKSEAEFMQGSKTYGEWVGKWQPILQRRGPKW